MNQIILEYILVNLFGLDQIHDYKADKRLTKNIAELQTIFREMKQSELSIGGGVMVKRYTEKKYKFPYNKTNIIYHTKKSTSKKSTSKKSTSKRSHSKRSHSKRSHSKRSTSNKIKLSVKSKNYIKKLNNKCQDKIYEILLYIIGIINFDNLNYKESIHNAFILYLQQITINNFDNELSYIIYKNLINVIYLVVKDSISKFENNNIQILQELISIKNINKIITILLNHNILYTNKNINFIGGNGSRSRSNSRSRSRSPKKQIFIEQPITSIELKEFIENSQDINCDYITSNIITIKEKINTYISTLIADKTFISGDKLFYSEFQPLRKINYDIDLITNFLKLFTENIIYIIEDCKPKNTLNVILENIIEIDAQINNLENTIEGKIDDLDKTEINISNSFNSRSGKFKKNPELSTDTNNEAKKFIENIITNCNNLYKKYNTMETNLQKIPEQINKLLDCCKEEKLSEKLSVSDKIVVNNIQIFIAKIVKQWIPQRQSTINSENCNTSDTSENLLKKIFTKQYNILNDYALQPFRNTNNYMPIFGVGKFESNLFDSFNKCINNKKIITGDNLFDFKQIFSTFKNEKTKRFFINNAAQGTVNDQDFTAYRFCPISSMIDSALTKDGGCSLTLPNANIAIKPKTPFERKKYIETGNMNVLLSTDNDINYKFIVRNISNDNYNITTTVEFPNKIKINSNYKYDLNDDSPVSAGKVHRLLCELLINEIQEKNYNNNLWDRLLEDDSFCKKFIEISCIKGTGDVSQVWNGTIKNGGFTVTDLNYHIGSNVEPYTNGDGKRMTLATDYVSSNLLMFILLFLPKEQINSLAVGGYFWSQSDKTKFGIVI